MNKSIATAILLVLATPQAKSAPKDISSPMLHAAFSYDDALWEGRIDSRQPANYSIRLRESGVVFGIMERRLPKGVQAADKILTDITAGIRADFETEVSDGLDGVHIPEGWSCHSFKMSPIGSNMPGLSRICVKVLAGHYEKMTIIVPSESISDTSVEALNRVISSLKDV